MGYWCMRKDCFFFWPIRVRFCEVDSQGIVYNGNYAIYVDEAFEEFLRFRGVSYQSLIHDHDMEVCHVKSVYEFHSSAFEGDMLEVGIRSIRLGNKSFTIDYEIYREGEDELILFNEAVYAGYDSKLRKSRPLSEKLRKILTVDEELKGGIK